MQYFQDYDERNIDNDYGTYGINSICWIDLLQPYVKSYQIFVCPSATNDDNLYKNPARSKYSYALNQVYSTTGVPGLRLFPSFIPALEDTSGTVFAGDSERFVTDGSANDVCGWQVVGDTYYPTTTPPSLGSNSQGRFAARHFDGMNFVFFDGHAKWLKITRATEKNAAGTYMKIFTPLLD